MFQVSMAIILYSNYGQCNSKWNTNKTTLMDRLYVKFNSRDKLLHIHTSSFLQIICKMASMCV